MLPVLHIGPAAVQTFLLALVAAIWIGTTMAERDAKQRGVDGDAVWNCVSIGLIGTIVAARLIYVAQNFASYAGNPLEIFSPQPGTLALSYGAIFGALAAYAYTQRKKLPLEPLLDSLAMGALVALAIFSFGQFLSGDAYGTPSNLPWAVFMWGEARHPVQLYDALGAILGWGVMTKLGRGKNIALWSVIWYSAVRLLVDAYRGEAMLLPGGFRVSQVVALAVLVIALWMARKKATNDERSTTNV